MQSQMMHVMNKKINNDSFFAITNDVIIYAITNDVIESQIM